MQKMILPPSAPAALSSPQRHCHLLLLFYLPNAAVTLETICKVNSVDDSTARQDIAEVAAKIQHYHRLVLRHEASGHYGLIGAELDQRLCLLHWLRRALRLVPDFVQQQFSPALKQHLKRMQTEKALYDEHNLQALVQHCALGLSRDFSSRDRQFLQLFIQHSLCRRASTDFTDSQRSWLNGRAEHQLAEEIVRHWQKRCHPAPDASEVWLFALLLSQLHAPVTTEIRYDYERELLAGVREMIAHFQALSANRFCNEQGLCDRLYTHLAQALERCLFGIRIDNSLTEEVPRLYPKLLRTTQAAVKAFEQRYNLTFSPEELGLIAILFGAWLMQENVLQEKQILLLTGKDAALEKEVEQQLRELTLLPLNIKYLDVAEYQSNSAPKGVALVITPYATPLPLYSPPLIHAELPLQPHQQQRIRLLLES
ncbi:stationary phase inducible protein CsiE [Pantoea sp. MBD-2R]|uniref:stationary phase inducible protein CsiE n=1 Tax=Pantoea sp. MBD-2R TaxID=3141540 RepID=UPI003183E71D